MASMQTQIDQINEKAAEELSEEDIELRSRLETLESSIKESQESSSTVFDEDSFPNSTMNPRHQRSDEDGWIRQDEHRRDVRPSRQSRPIHRRVDSSAPGIIDSSYNDDGQPVSTEL